MAVAANDVHRWKREEYERMAAQGFFPPEARVELVDGIVYDMAPQNSPHTTGLHLGLQFLSRAFPDCYVRVQSPLALDDDSEPEPDLAVAEGKIVDYAKSHPATALLVIEVSDQSLAHDRNRKIPLYARSGIPEAWLLNLKAKTLEVYRDPGMGAYRSRQILRAGATISPLARPEAQIVVADLFPR